MLPIWHWRKVTKMVQTAKQDKPFELDRLEFGFFVVVWEVWKRHNPDRPHNPAVQRFNKRIAKHWENAYR